MYRYAFLLAAGSLISTTAIAQTAPAPAAPTAQPTPAATAAAGATVGASIYDAQGGLVGTIAAINGGNATIDTGTVKAAVPVASLGTGPKGPILGLTKAQLEAAAGQQASAAGDIKAKLVAGTQVYGTGGTAVGTIKAADAQFVTLTTPKGDVKLPVNGFGAGPNGVTIGLSADQLAAAMSAAPK